MRKHTNKTTNELHENLYDEYFFHKYNHESTLKCWCDHGGVIWIEITNSINPSQVFRLFPEGANSLNAKLDKLIKAQSEIWEEKSRSLEEISGPKEDD